MIKQPIVEPGIALTEWSVARLLTSHYEEVNSEDLAKLKVWLASGPSDELISRLVEKVDERYIQVLLQYLPIKNEESIAWKLGMTNWLRTKGLAKNESLPEGLVEKFMKSCLSWLDGFLNIGGECVNDSFEALLARKEWPEEFWVKQEESLKRIELGAWRRLLANPGTRNVEYLHKLALEVNEPILLGLLIDVGRQEIKDQAAAKIIERWPGVVTKLLEKGMTTDEEERWRKVSRQAWSGMVSHPDREIRRRIVVWLAKGEEPKAGLKR